MCDGGRMSGREGKAAECRAWMDQGCSQLWVVLLHVLHLQGRLDLQLSLLHRATHMSARSRMSGLE